MVETPRVEDTGSLLNSGLRLIKIERKFNQAPFKLTNECSFSNKNCYSVKLKTKLTWNLNSWS